MCGLILVLSWSLSILATFSSSFVFLRGLCSLIHYPTFLTFILYSADLSAADTQRTFMNCLKYCHNLGLRPLLPSCASSFYPSRITCTTPIRTHMWQNYWLKDQTVQKNRLLTREWGQTKHKQDVTLVYFMQSQV